MGAKEVVIFGDVKYFCFEPFSGCFYVVKVFGLIPKLGTVKCMKVYDNKDEICDIVVLKEKIRLL